MALDTTVRPLAPDFSSAKHAESLVCLDLNGLSNGKVLPDILDLLNSKRAEVESAALPPYHLARRRWFGRKDETLSTCRIACISGLPGDDRTMVLCEIETTGKGLEAHGPERWLLPLAIVWADDVQPLSKDLAVAEVSFQGTAGILTDAFSLLGFAGSLLEGLSSMARSAASEGEVVFEAGRGMQMPSHKSVAWLSAEQSNSSLVVGGSVMLKIFRRVAGGPHPEAEMSRSLQLGSRPGFSANRPAWLTVPVQGLLEIVRRILGHPPAAAP